MKRVRSVLVTGTSTGFGYATAVALDAAGWRVFAGVRTAADAERLRGVLSSRSEPVHLDVTSERDIIAVRDHVLTQTRGTLDGLVNNAGIVYMAPLEKLTTQAVREQLEVNVLGPFALTKAFLPALRTAKGRVVNVGSISGRVAWPYNGTYAASKHAFDALTYAMQVELRPFGVRVILVEPGAFKTAIWEKRVPPELIESGSLEPPVEAHYAWVQNAVDTALEKIDRSAPAPDPVVRTIVHALQTARPCVRYTVGTDAYAQLTLRLLPRAWRVAALGTAIAVAVRLARRR